MHINPRGAWLLAPLAALLLCSCISMAPPAAITTEDGLKQAPSTKVDRLFTAPGMSLAPYRRVLLDPVRLAFKDDWQRIQPPVTPENLARIRTAVANLFHDVGAAELAGNGGYPLADAPAADVLHVTATLSDLRITAAHGNAGPNPHLVSGADMTLMVELRDSQSGALLARAVDREHSREAGNLRVVDQLANSEEAQRAFAGWARLLRATLDAAKAPPAAP